MLGCLACSATAHAAGPLQLSGLIDTYVAWDTSQPSSGAVPGLTTGSRHALPSVNLILLEGRLSVASFHVQLDVGAGAALDALHSPDPTLPRPSDGWRYLAQAYLGYTLPVGRGLTIDAGLMQSHLGYEAFAPRDNWSYTHSWMADLSPYYRAGVRARYLISEHLSAQLLWLNGWGSVDQDRGFRSAGAQLAWRSDGAAAALNFYAGPSHAGATGTRLYADAWAEVSATAQLKFAVVLDGGIDLLPAGEATWYAGATYVRYQPIRRLGFTARADLLDDRGGGSVTGAGERLVEATLTGALILGPLEARLEARLDHAGAPMWDGRPQRGLLLAALMGKF